MPRKPAVDPHPNNRREQYSADFIYDAQEASRLVNKAFRSLIDKGYSIRDVSHYLMCEVYGVELDQVLEWMDQGLDVSSNEGD